MKFRLAELLLGVICLITAIFFFYREYQFVLEEEPVSDEEEIAEIREEPAEEKARGEKLLDEVALDKEKKDVIYDEPKRSQDKHKVRFGDTLYSFLLRHIQSVEDVQEIVRLLRSNNLLKTLRAGQEFVFIDQKTSTSSPRTLSKVIFFLPKKRVSIEKLPDGSFSLHKEPLSYKKKYIEGVITQSLYIDAKKEGAPLSTTNQFVQLLSHKVDFQRSIHSGDTFQILMNVYTDGETGKEIYGDIIYGGLALKEGKVEVYRFRAADGTIQYYNGKGEGTIKALLKTPVPGAAISGKYGWRKKHPVLGYSKMHRGIDFAARTGTPILAAGTGVVKKAYRWGSYGNYVRIQHNNEYATAYAHLSKYAQGIRAGKKVKQGQVIGYVGATGRATGPHLHYEILRNGKQINPQSLKLPSQQNLIGKELTAFRTQKASIDKAMEELRRPG